MSEESESRRVLRLFHRSYVLALALIACLLIGLALLSQRRLATQHDDAALINLAGRQRMLSQRLSKELLLEQKHRGPSEEVVATILKEWNQAHQALRQQARSEGTTALFIQLDPLVADITRLAKRYLNSEESEDLDSLLQKEGQFLGLMEALVRTFELEASARVQKEIWLQWAMLGILLSLLAVEAGMIFHPLTKRLQQAFRSLTDARNQTEEALKESQRADQLKGEFLANVSHEIRTPMNGILGMSELLLEREKDQDSKEYAQIIHHSAECLLSILNDLLDMSKIQAGEFQLLESDFDLLVEVDEVVKLQEVVAAKKGLEMLLDVKPGVPQRVKGDRYRLRQVLLNLVSNAVKFTDKGHVMVTVEMLDGKIRFSVVDTGPGIPKDQAKEIFEPFRQVDGSHTRAHMGTGLGLSIASNLVRLMGGELRLESEPQKGSTFFFSLSLPAEKSKKGDSLSLLRGKRILIVDDVAANRLLLKSWASDWGAHYKEADSGAKALEVASNETFDFILVDFQMPGMDGLEVAERLGQGRARLVALPSALEEEAELFRQAGFHGVIRKPVRRRILELLLASLLDNQTEFVTPDALLRAKSQPHPERQETVRILVVDDNKLNCNVAARFAKRLGFVCEPALSGKAALEICQKESFDLILMDLQMPEMDGFETTQKLREAGYSNLIVALTANTTKGIREKCLRSGMDGYLSKPLSKASLLSVMPERIANQQ